MREDIKACAALGANGIVMGILTANGEIDVDRVSRIQLGTRSPNLTCAFDKTSVMRELQVHD
jgi:copper homeostasis protein CutC